MENQLELQGNLTWENIKEKEKEKERECEGVSKENEKLQKHNKKIQKSNQAQIDEFTMSQ